MGIKTKAYRGSHAQFVDYLIACMKLRVAAIKLQKSVITRCKVCDRDTLVSTTYTCDCCGKSVCADCIIRLENAPDDLKDVCIECMNGRG